jgi:hypothetical protein
MIDNFDWKSKVLHCPKSDESVEKSDGRGEDRFTGGIWRSVFDSFSKTLEFATSLFRTAVTWR